MALLCFMILGILFACKKDKTIKKDEIINHTFSPALAFQTVRNFTSINNPSCQTNIPTPSDSTTVYLLDINEDQIPDFKFDLSHSNTRAVIVDLVMYTPILLQLKVFLQITKLLVQTMPYQQLHC